jgi:hypothetical protein
MAPGIWKVESEPDVEPCIQMVASSSTSNSSNLSYSPSASTRTTVQNGNLDRTSAPENQPVKLEDQDGFETGIGSNSNQMNALVDIAVVVG